jgi:hypothetical protein
VTAGAAARLLGPIAVAVLLALADAPPAVAVAVTPVVAVDITPAEPRPGDVVLIRVPAAWPGLAGEWDGRPVLRFFPLGTGLAALVGVDLDVRPGKLPWRLTRPETVGVGTATLRSGWVTIRPRTFETQHLTLPRHQVDLDPSTLARVTAEREAMNAALAGTAAERLWRGPFLTPLDGGQPTGGFGLRRVINGQPRSPHSGYDWGAPRGTPVLAAGAGRVALVAEQFFSGRMVVIDHGLGLHTHYYHLDAVQVVAGDAVSRGQTIGKVGATGRVTGPHLHFGVSLSGARVDPMTLLGLAVPAE